MIVYSLEGRQGVCPYESYLSIKSPDVGVTPRSYLSSLSHTKDGLPEW